MPVDTSAINSILAAWQAGIKFRQEKENRIAQQMYQQQKLEQDAQQFKEQMALSKERFVAENELHKGQYKLDEVKMKAMIADMLSQGKIAGTPNASNTQQTVDTGLGGPSFAAPTPQAQLGQQVTAINTLAPAQANAAGQKAGAVQAATLPGQLELASTKANLDLEKRLTVEEARAATSKDIAELHNKGLIDAAKIRGRYAIDVANIRKQTNTIDLDDPGVQNAMKDLAAGVISTGDLLKNGYTMAQRKAVNDALTARNLVPVNEQTKTNLQKLSPIKGIYEDVVKLRDMIKNDTIKASLPFSDARALKDRIDGRLAILATGIGGQRGAISQKDVDAMRGYVAKFSYGFTNPTANDAIVTGFEKTILTAQKTALAGFSPEQVNIIVNTHGLLSPYEEIK